MSDSHTVKVDEAAKILGFSRNAVYDAIHRGEIPVIRLGRAIRIPRRAIEQMLEQAVAA